MLRSLREKILYTFILYYIKDTLARRVRARSEPSQSCERTEVSHQMKRFVDIKPEDISGSASSALHPHPPDVLLSFLTSREPKFCRNIYTRSLRDHSEKFFSHLYINIYIYTHLYLCLSRYIYVRALAKVKVSRRGE